MISRLAMTRRLKAIRIISVVVLISLWLGIAELSTAKSYCEPVNGESPARWPIPEERFTKENALNAAKELIEVVKEEDQEDLVVGLECEIKNRTVILEGYALRSAIEDVPEERRQMPIERFCTFLRNEAFVCH